MARKNFRHDPVRAVMAGCSASPLLRPLEYCARKKRAGVYE
jgi:hypothetical protein